MSRIFFKGSSSTSDEEVYARFRSSVRRVRGSWVFVLVILGLSLLCASAFAGMPSSDQYGGYDPPSGAALDPQGMDAWGASETADGNASGTNVLSTLLPDTGGIPIMIYLAVFAVSIMGILLFRSGRRGGREE